MSIYKRASGKWTAFVDLDVQQPYRVFVTLPPRADGAARSKTLGNFVTIGDAERAKAKAVAGGETRAVGIQRTARRRSALGTYATRKEAERAEREALGARDRGIDLRPESVDVNGLLKRYLNDAAMRCGAKTMERYREIARSYIEPHLGKVLLAKLRPAHLSEWVVAILASGGAKGRSLSPKTVSHAFSLFKSALAWSVKMQLLAVNPALAVNTPRVPRSPVVALTADEVKAVLDIAEGTRWANVFAFGVGTGARRGEIAGLKWSDVNFDGRSVRIERSLSDTREGIAVKGTKTERVRSVPLSAIALDALRRQKAAQARDRLASGGDFVDLGYVFTGPKGGTPQPYDFSEAFRVLAKRAHVSITSFHALRHSAGTALIASGVDAKTVASILGHASPVTTLTIYAHVVPSVQTAAVEKIDAFLRPRRAVGDDA